MQNENSPEPIGEPQPIKTQKWQSLLKKATKVIAISSGGLVAFAVFVAPTRTLGATRSAKLKWLERDKETRQVVEGSFGADAKASENPKIPAPPVSSGK